MVVEVNIEQISNVNNRSNLREKLFKPLKITVDVVNIKSHRSMISPNMNFSPEAN